MDNTNNPKSVYCPRFGIPAKAPLDPVRCTVKQTATAHRKRAVC